MENPIEMDNPHDLLGESIFVRENRMSSSLFFPFHGLKVRHGQEGDGRSLLGVAAGGASNQGASPKAWKRRRKNTLCWVFSRGNMGV
jgi:hypothetical protein